MIEIKLSDFFVGVGEVFESMLSELLLSVFIFEELLARFMP